MTPLRWMLVLDRHPTDDEFAYTYQFLLYELNPSAGSARPATVIHTADDLVDTLFARRTASTVATATKSKSD